MADDRKLDIGTKVFSAVAAMAAAFVARKVITLVWTKATGKEPPTHPEDPQVAVTEALGWSVLTVIQPLSQSVPINALLLLCLGGGLYSVGVVFHVWRSLPYQNAIWHLFVLAGTACHFAAVTQAVFA